MSWGEGSNVSTTPPFGTMLVTSTFVPPTWRTRSASTVVVATTFTASGAGVGPEGPGAADPVHPATARIRTANARPSLSERVGAAAVRSESIGSGRCAGGAAPEQLEPVAVDPEPGPALDG